MSHGSLERRGLISSNLCEAVEIEIDISDLLCEGYTCDSREMKRSYEQAREVSDQLDDFEKLIVGGVGKKLWRERVNNIANPEAHPEYSPTMDHEISEYLQRLENLPNDQLRQIAQAIIDFVGLPPTTRQAA
jgi:hypothetical protein